MNRSKTRPTNELQEIARESRSYFCFPRADAALLHDAEELLPFAAASKTIIDTRLV